MALFSEALPGLLKQKWIVNLGWLEQNTIVQSVESIMAMYLMMDQVQLEKRFCNNGLCLIFKPSN